MPFCPRCRAEYRDGFTTCALCEVELVETMDQLPVALDDERVAELLRDKQLVRLVHGGVEACKDVQQALLREQIPAAIMPPENTDLGSGVAMILDVAVPEDQVDRAKELLTAHWHETLIRDGLRFDFIEEDDSSDDDEKPLACPACGSTKPLKKGACRDCGLQLDDTE